MVGAIFSWTLESRGGSLNTRLSWYRSKNLVKDSRNFGSSFADFQNFQAEWKEWKTSIGSYPSSDLERSSRVPLSEWFHWVFLAKILVSMIRNCFQRMPFKVDETNCCERLVRRRKPFASINRFLLVLQNLIGKWSASIISKIEWRSRLSPQEALRDLRKFHSTIRIQNGWLGCWRITRTIARDWFRSDFERSVAKKQTGRVCGLSRPKRVAHRVRIPAEDRPFGHLCTYRKLCRLYGKASTWTMKENHS